MKKILLFLVAAMLAALARAADGDTFTYQGLKFKVTSETDHTVAVDRNENVSGDISIPSFAVNGSSRYFVTKIKNDAFSYCYSLISVSVPNSVTEIGIGAFSDCSNLLEIVVENGNSNYISEDGVVFNIDKTEIIVYPGGKTGEYSIPTSVTKIGEFAFCGCRSLTLVTIPNSVTKIGEGAFCDCSSLTSVCIPNSVTIIDAATFFACISLTSVTIPASTTQIRYDSFSCCSGLKTIYDLNPIPQEIGGAAFSMVPSDVVVYIPKGSFKDYSVASGWTKFIDFREMGAFYVVLSEQTLELTSDNTATVTATVTKDNDMTVESEEWSSSNPEVATVDNGVITAVAPGDAVIRFTAVAANGLTCTESCTVTVSESSGFVEIATDSDASVDVYNLQGVAVLRNAAAAELRNLPAGLYIVRQGRSVKKIAVK